MGAWVLNKLLFRDSLDTLVTAFCHDYFARERVLRDKACSRRTGMEYEYINRRIHDAAAEVAGAECEIYIREIGERIGYAKSDVADISESQYKLIKKEVKLNIARKLHLID